MQNKSAAIYATKAAKRATKDQHEISHFVCNSFSSESFFIQYVMMPNDAKWQRLHRVKEQGLNCTCRVGRGPWAVSVLRLTQHADTWDAPRQSTVWLRSLCPPALKTNRHRRWYALLLSGSCTNMVSWNGRFQSPKSQKSTCDQQHKVWGFMQKVKTCKPVSISSSQSW